MSTLTQRNEAFGFSHLGWMLREYHPDRYGDYSNCRDLQKDKIVMWQHKHYLALTLATNFGFPIAFGLLHGDVWGAILLVGFTRLVLSIIPPFSLTPWLTYGGVSRIQRRIQPAIMAS